MLAVAFKNLSQEENHDNVSVQGKNIENIVQGS